MNNNKETKQQEPIVRCAVMRCFWKWLLAIGILNLIVIIILLIARLIIYGNQELTMRWFCMWYGITLGVLILSGITAIITYWKNIKEWIRNELCCV